MLIVLLTKINKNVVDRNLIDSDQYCLGILVYYGLLLLFFTDIIQVR